MKTTKTNTYFDNPGIRRTVQYACSLTRDRPLPAYTVICGTHALSCGLERTLSRSPRIMARAAVSVAKEVVAVGGTEEGADTVLVIRPSHIASFFDLQVREVVAMPRNR